MQDFDETFSNYLETYETDEMFNNFFSAVRKAYIAGYKAAGGENPKSQPVLTLVKHFESKNDKITADLCTQEGNLNHRL